MIVLILFIGLGVDLGFSYITQANLSKAVDAAALMGASSLSQGSNTAQAVALAAFDLNYGVSSRDAAAPNVIVQTFTDAHDNEVVDVSASVNINTFFIRVLPQWTTLAVASTAEAVRNNVIMTLVLDTSGSMAPSHGAPPGGDGTGSGGGQFLPDAVTTFINNFDDVHDKAAVVSFASKQSNVFFGGTPPQPTRPFRSQITAAVNNFIWTNSTFSQGGLTNALVLENNATIPANQSTIKIVVFCTDGLANIVQDTFNCPPLTTLNFGGQDANNGCGFYDPNTGEYLPDGAGDHCFLEDGGAPPCCPGVSQFRSAVDGSMQPFIRTNVTVDATFRAVQVAKQMREAGIVVYSIGVGTGIDLTFLQQVANDSALAGTADYAATPFDGQAVVANDPAHLSEVFQAIASKILLRLSK
jgi:Flp pilus assembly protein TadG